MVFTIRLEEETGKAFCIPKTDANDVIVFSEKRYYKAFETLKLDGIFNGFMFDNAERICENYDMSLDEVIRILRMPSVITIEPIKKINTEEEQEKEEEEDGFPKIEYEIEEDKIPTLTVIENGIRLDINGNRYEYCKDNTENFIKFKEDKNSEAVTDIVNMLYMTNQELYDDVTDTALHLYEAIQKSDLA